MKRHSLSQSQLKLSATLARVITVVLIVGWAQLAWPQNDVKSPAQWYQCEALEHLLAGPADSPNFGFNELYIFKQLYKLTYKCNTLLCVQKHTTEAVPVVELVFSDSEYGVITFPAYRVQATTSNGEVYQVQELHQQSFSRRDSEICIDGGSPPSASDAQREEIVDGWRHLSNSPVSGAPEGFIVFIEPSQGQACYCAAKLLEESDSPGSDHSTTGHGIGAECVPVTGFAMAGQRH